MSNPWDSEFPITETLVHKLLACQFPQLKPLQISRLGQGWDNAAFLVNQCYVFRFPQREIAAPAILIENRVLPCLAPILPLNIPLPIFHGDPQDPFPWPFSDYEILPGILACSARLADSQREACARPLGHFLKSLHLATAKLPAGILPVDPFGRCDTHKTHTRLATYLEKAESHLSPSFKTALDRVLKNPPRFNLRRDCVVHGDLYVRHLLVTEQRNLAGVIDWGDCVLADPGVDLAIAWTFLPPSAQAAFLEAYGPVAPDSWSYASLFGAFYGMVLSHFGQETCDEDLLFEGRQILRYWETYSRTAPWT